VSVPAEPDAYELSVPADPSGLSTVRVFLRAVARSVDAEPERSDDLELIVSELCTALLEGASTRLRIEVAVGRSGFDVTVDGDAPPSAPGDNPIRTDLLATLAPDMTWNDHGARLSLSLVPGGDGSVQAR
jgi:hypothetical protein